jgi:hypothetical protein
VWSPTLVETSTSVARSGSSWPVARTHGEAPSAAHSVTGVPAGGKRSTAVAGSCRQGGSQQPQQLTSEHDLLLGECSCRRGGGAGYSTSVECLFSIK